MAYSIDTHARRLMTVQLLMSSAVTSIKHGGYTTPYEYIKQHRHLYRTVLKAGELKMLRHD